MKSGSTFKGLEIELHRLSGAHVLRVVHPGAQKIPEHRHDWAYIGLYTAGRYRERYDGGAAGMRGPCAVLHPAGRPHADIVEPEGLETLTIEFEPDWLKRHGFGAKLDRSRLWSGGQVGLASRRLGAILPRRRTPNIRWARNRGIFIWRSPAKAGRRSLMVRRYSAATDKPEPISANKLARRLGMHPACVGASLSSRNRRGDW